MKSKQKQCNCPDINDGCRLDCPLHGTDTNTKQKKGEKITVYKVDDKNEVPIYYDDLQYAVETVKALLEGISVGYPIEITKEEMTQEKYDSILEL